jgi:hypothetical protein
LVFFHQDRVANSLEQTEPPQSVKLHFGAANDIPNAPQSCELEDVLMKFFIRVQVGVSVALSGSDGVDATRR